MPVDQDVHQLVTELRRDQAVLGVIAFGSLARRELTATSDIDLLVVHDPSTSARELRGTVALAAERVALHLRVAPVFFTPAALQREFERHPSFAAHLADEGVVVFSRPDFVEAAKTLNSPQVTRDALQRELADRVSRLALFSDLERFNDEYVPCLAQLYSLGRSIVIVKLLENGIHEYSWRKVFDRYSTVRPELDNDLDRVEDLRVYYEHVNNRSELPLVRRHVDPDYVGDAIESISAVAAS